MIKTRCRLPLLALFGILAVSSLSGCRSMFNSEPAANNAKSPLQLSRLAKQESLGATGSRRPPPLLLSVPAATRTPPPLLTAPQVAEAAAAKAITPPDGTVLPELAIPLPATEPPSGFFIPNSMFGIPPKPAAVTTTKETAPVASNASAPRRSGPNTPAVDVVAAPRLLAGVYISPTTRAYFAAGGMDYVQMIIQPWENFLQQNNIEAVRITSSAALLNTRMDVLILPSAVALNAAERTQLARLREQGKSMMATWLTGVRNENGQWLGFDFMQQVLDTSVSGTTAEDEEDSFIFPQGDSPLTHQLPAGLRIWVERIADWYPLRLVGKHSALRVMDWSRTVRPGKSTNVMSYDERDGIAPSRVAVLGIPERLWQSIAVNDFNKMLYDTLYWLARRPDAYLAAWPQARSTGVMLAFDAPDPLNEVDFTAHELAEAFGGKATYFLLSEHLEKTPAEILAKLRHSKLEVAMMGDRFLGFKDEAAGKQAKRLSLMLDEANAAGVTLPKTPGFHAPMESFDQNTNKLLAEKNFAYQITDSSTSESQLPVIAKTDKHELMLYPRSLAGIDGLLNDGLPLPVANQKFSESLRIHADLGGLTIIPISQTDPLTPAQWKQTLISGLGSAHQPWLATGQEIAIWWREHERVSASIDHSVSPALLTVEIRGEGALQEPVSILLNQPAGTRGFRLIQDNMDEKAFELNASAHDRWRQSVSLRGALPGVYHWYLLPASGIASSSLRP